MGQFRAAEGAGVCGLLQCIKIVYVSLYNQLLTKGINKNHTPVTDRAEVNI